MSSAVSSPSKIQRSELHSHRNIPGSLTSARHILNQAHRLICHQQCLLHQRYRSLSFTPNSTALAVSPVLDTFLVPLQQHVRCDPPQQHASGGLQSQRDDMEVVLVVQHPLHTQHTQQCVGGDPRGLLVSGDLLGQSRDTGDCSGPYRLDPQFLLHFFSLLLFFLLHFLLLILYVCR